MSQLLELQIGGLFTNPNGLSAVPPGTMSIAENVVIDRESVVESRRGLRVYGDTIGASDPRSMWTYQDRLIVHTEGNQVFYDSDAAGTWTAFAGTFTSPDSTTRIRAFQSNKNCFFTTANGLYKMTAYNSTPTAAGAPKGLGGSGSVTGATGFFTNNTNVAYRIVWGYKDSNNNLILGAPSDRIVVANTAGGLRNVSLTFQVPVGITTSWFYQVYRSPMSANISTEPSDDLQQVYEASPTAGEITARSITITDIVTDDLKQTALYTNSTQEGIGNANWQPPFAKDVCLFKNHAFYANTRSVHRLYENLLATGATSGIQNGDTITFTIVGGASFVVTGGAAENTATGTFKVTTTGTPAENVDATARSIAKVVNAYASNTFLNAYYVSGFDDLPGQLLFERRDLSATAFTMASSRGTAWTPVPTQTSTNDTFPNRIYISKIQQPEAVPLLNYIDIGSSTEPIERILALRDGVLVLKTDGIYRVSGDTVSSFRVALIDNTVRILARDSAVVLSNQVFFFCDQGIVAASDTSVKVISRPIENLLTPLMGVTAFPNLATESFGVGYESDRKYIFFVPTNEGDTPDTYSKKAFVYNVFTNSWTNWIKDANCGLVNPATNKLYLGCPVDGIQAHIKEERKDFGPSDYADEEFDVTIVGQVGQVIQLNTTANLVAGDTIYQNGVALYILSIDNATDITVEAGLTLGAGPATVYRPIQVHCTFDNIDAGNPGALKHFRRISYFFGDSNFDRMSSTFESDLSAATGVIEITRSKKYGWGSGTWGTVPWGGSVNELQRVEAIVPQTNQRCNWLDITVELNTAFSSLQLNGISLHYNKMSERFK